MTSLSAASGGLRSICTTWIWNWAKRRVPVACDASARAAAPAHTSAITIRESATFIIAIPLRIHCLPHEKGHEPHIVQNQIRPLGGYDGNARRVARVVWTFARAATN